MSSVVLHRDEAVAVITLSRPHALNAMSQDVMQALDSILDSVSADETIRAVVVTGAGKAFSAGGDLVEFAALREAGPHHLIDALAFNQRVLEKLQSLPTPVIAAVNGAAVAGGLELVLCCDVVIAASSARLGDGHAQYAIIPAGGATARLARKLPANIAMHLFFSAELYSAEQFAVWGLVNEVTPDSEVVSRAVALAKGYAQMSREVLAAVKRLTHASAGPLAELARFELQEFTSYVNHPDLVAGLQKFVARRRASCSNEAAT